LIVAPELLDGEEAVLTGEVLHHVRRVLRLRAGAPLLLVDGTGRSREGTLLEVTAEAARVALGAAAFAPPEPAPRLTLIHGVARGARTEWVLQKATELGASRIILAVCQRSVARPADLERKSARWREVVDQAARQCTRSHVPEVAPALFFADALRAASSAGLRLIADLRAARGLADLRAALANPPDEIAIAVGPEGGFTDDELAAATAQGFTPVRLGTNVLRTETAAIAALAVVAHLCGKL
jgi:16S rRNA (uracil1498-N3)-methyltransferase